MGAQRWGLRGGRGRLRAQGGACWKGDLRRYLCELLHLMATTMENGKKDEFSGGGWVACLHTAGNLRLHRPHPAAPLRPAHLTPRRLWPWALVATPTWWGEVSLPLAPACPPGGTLSHSTT